MKRQFAQFVVRWLLNVVGLFVAALFLTGVDYQDNWFTLVIAGLVLSVINALIKPFLIILALPALILTLGIFTVVINGLMVYLAHLLYSSFEVSSFTTAILAGMVIGLVNYILTRIFDVFVTED